MAKKRRKKEQDYIAETVGEPSASAVLKKQSKYGDENWQPGEIPTRGSLRPVFGPIVDRPKSAYGERLGVESPPKERGRGKPREGQL